MNTAQKERTRYVDIRLTENEAFRLGWWGSIVKLPVDTDKISESVKNIVSRAADKTLNQWSEQVRSISRKR